MDRQRQGDLGELSALAWLAERGHPVFVPVGHSADVDLVAWIDGRFAGVQVKTTARALPSGRWQPMLCTRGGNRSWTGETKRFDSSRCDFLFVHVGDGRRWFIPAARVQATTGIVLGGPKYREFEIETGRPLI